MENEKKVCNAKIQTTFIPNVREPYSMFHDLGSNDMDTKGIRTPRLP